MEATRLTPYSLEPLKQTRGYEISGASCRSGLEPAVVRLDPTKSQFFPENGTSRWSPLRLPGTQATQKPVPPPFRANGVRLVCPSPNPQLTRVAGTTTREPESH